MTATLTLWWGDPRLAVQYRADLLASCRRAADARPCARGPCGAGLAGQPGGAAAGARGLAYRYAAHAVAQPCPRPRLVAAAPTGCLGGVDPAGGPTRSRYGRAGGMVLYRRRAGGPGRCGEARRLRAFYQLWTLKESFIKAAGLDFPADMRSVEDWRRTRHRRLRRRRGRPWAGWRLRAPGPGWHARSAMLDDAWAASVVLARARYRGHGRRGCGRYVHAGAGLGRQYRWPWRPPCRRPRRHPRRWRRRSVWRTARARSPRILPAGQWR